MSRRLAFGLGILAWQSACFSPDGSPGQDTDATDGSTGTASDTAQTTSPLTTETTASTGQSSVTETASATETSTSSSTTDPTGADTGSTGGVEVLECVESLLDPPQGNAIVQVDTNTASNDFMGSCGGINTNDVAYQWMVPFSDYFVIDTQGSDYDTVLYLRNDECEGLELGCSDNAEGSVYSEIVAPFEAGQRVVVVIDGAAGAHGNAQLNINPVECPSADLSGQALPANFSNVAGTNEFDSGCGGAGNPERTFRFTAEEAGLYSFRAFSQAFAPIMVVEDGPICGGDRWQCNRGQPNGQVPGEVIRNLQAGQSVTLIVDSAGGTGDFDVDVVNLGQTCPQIDFDAVGPPYDFTITDFDHRMTTSCAPVGEVFGMELNLFEAATFHWTSPGQVGTSSGCDIIYTGGFPAALSLQEGNCDAAEVQCEEATAGATDYTAMVTVGHIPPTEFTITLVRAAENLVMTFGQDFSIEIVCYAIG